MYDLGTFSLTDMTQCGRALRTIGDDAASMEETATRIVRFFRASFGESGAPACALVRCFVTVPFAELAPELQAVARTAVGAQHLAPRTKCLTLLASAGDLPSWNSPHTSAGHRALPLANRESVARAPMIARLIAQFGLDPDVLLAPSPALLLDGDQRTFNVFHVSDALGSPYIPAQDDFVVPHHIRSVVGFGGPLPDGEVFAIVIFARSGIARPTADLFRTLALSAKVALLPFVGGRRFA